MLVLIIYAYVSIFLFIALSIYKARQFTKMPLHGRMELYPVPKEKGKSEYGGSYYEEVEWWKKPRVLSGMTELKEMLKEMLFIKKLFENQRPLWWISYALHLGIYCLTGWTVLLLVGAITELAGLPVTLGADGSAWGMVLYYLTSLVGMVGLILAALGSAFLLFRRMVDGALKKYTTPQEYFNLLLIFAVLLTGILAWTSDLSFQPVRNLMEHILTFSPLQVPPMVMLHMVLLGIMFIYIPLSKMSHYVGKYFTFHKVLWENDPNLTGSEIEKKVKEATSYRPQNKWSAPHINPPAPESHQ